MGRAEDIVMSKSRCSPWGMCTLVLNQEWYTHTYSKAFEKVTLGGHNQCAKLPTQNCSHGSRSFKSHRMALPKFQNGIDTWTEPQPNHKGHTHVGEQNFATVSQSWLLHLEKPAWLLCSLGLRPCANSIPTDPSRASVRPRELWFLFHSSETQRGQDTCLKQYYGARIWTQTLWFWRTSFLTICYKSRKSWAWKPQPTWENNRDATMTKCPSRNSCEFLQHL